ncbi:MAG: phospholipase D-like domain-containing protein [Pirellulales bacterium]
MNNKYGRIQGQHVLGAGFLATLLGVLFNLSSSKVNNFLPQLTDTALAYTNSAYLDPYSNAYSNGLSGNQAFSTGYGDSYGYTQQPYASQASYNGSLGGRYQNASYTSGSTYPNISSLNNGYGSTGYQNASYQTGYQFGYPTGSQGGNYPSNNFAGNNFAGNSYASTNSLGTGYSGSNYLNNSYANNGYGNNAYANSTYANNNGWSATNSYLNNNQLSNGSYASTVSYANQAGYPNSYSVLNSNSGGFNSAGYNSAGYNSAGYNSAGYGSSNLGRTQQYGAAIRAYFSPNGGCTDAIVRELQQAQRQIFIQAYSFTSEPIAMAVVSAQRRGVQVVVILDKSQMSEQNSAAEYLANSGVTTMIDSTHQIAHNKVILIDGRTIITGSFNFTYNAEHSNAENLLVIYDNVDLYAAYDANFRRCYSHSSVYASRTSNRSNLIYR